MKQKLQAARSATGVRVHLYDPTVYSERLRKEGRARAICGAFVYNLASGIVSRSMMCCVCSRNLVDVKAEDIDCQELTA